MVAVRGHPVRGRRGPCPTGVGGDPILHRKCRNSRCVRVRIYWRATSAVPVSEPIGNPRIRLSDDTGTEYTTFPAQSQSDGIFRWGIIQFLPTTPVAVHRLALRIAGFDGYASPTVVRRPGVDRPVLSIDLG